MSTAYLLTLYRGRYTPARGRGYLAIPGKPGRRDHTRRRQGLPAYLGMARFIKIRSVGR